MDSLHVNKSSHTEQVIFSANANSAVKGKRVFLINSVKYLKPDERKDRKERLTHLKINQNRKNKESICKDSLLEDETSTSLTEFSSSYILPESVKVQKKKSKLPKKLQSIWISIFKRN